MDTAGTASFLQPNFRVKFNSGSVNKLITHNLWLPHPLHQLDTIICLSRNFIFLDKILIIHNRACTNSFNHRFLDVFILCPFKELTFLKLKIFYLHRWFHEACLKGPRTVFVFILYCSLRPTYNVITFFFYIKKII